MPFQIVRNDITRMRVDAIVSAANRRLEGGGGVDGAIHRAAGPALAAECQALGECDPGDAKATGAGNLPCRFVIHAVGPVWRGGTQGERKVLASAYRRALEVAQGKRCKSVAFPLISAGSYGFPPEEALRVATRTIEAFVRTHAMMVYLVIFDDEAFRAGSALPLGVLSLIDAAYVREHPESLRRRSERRLAALADLFPGHRDVAPSPRLALRPPFPESVDAAVGAAGEGFSETLLRKIRERGLKESTCYRRANIDRRLFSKIRSDKHYRPSKQTAVAFAMALRMPMDELRDFLLTAGFALGHAQAFDIIVEYFVRQGEYDVFRINEELFRFGQPLLGSV